MKRIAICQFGNETNTFAAGRTTLKDLSAEGWIAKETVCERFSGTKTYVGGALKAIHDCGAVPVPMDLITLAGNFGAGPLMETACADQVMDHICSDLHTHADEYDGVFFAVHGAGCAEDYEDLEAYAFKRVREVIGTKPMMSSLDLHGNITQEMLDLSDGLFGIKTVPHTDCYDAGYRAGKALCDLLDNKCSLKMALQKLPLLISSSAGSTLGGTAKEVMEYTASCVAEYGLLDATFFHGFSSTDRACSSASVLTIAKDFDPMPIAQKIANYVWEKREGFLADSYSASEAFDQALGMQKGGYVVINESSDNPGSGCPGDSTHLLREFIRRDMPGTIMGPIFDPAAAAICHSHTVGDMFALEVGGHKEAICGAPMLFDSVELLSLADGEFVSAAPINFGAKMHYGPSARLRYGNVEFIVVSERMQVYDDRSFLMMGCNMKDYSIVGLKSMNHFRGYFVPIADGIVAADTPGLRPADLRTVAYHHVNRPIYPIDTEVMFIVS